MDPSSGEFDYGPVPAGRLYARGMPMNSLKRRFGGKKSAEPTQTELLIEIRDLLAVRADDDRSSDATEKALDKAALSKAARALD